MFFFIVWPPDVTIIILLIAYFTIIAAVLKLDFNNRDYSFEIKHLETRANIVRLAFSYRLGLLKASVLVLAIR